MVRGRRAAAGGRGRRGRPAVRGQGGGPVLGRAGRRRLSAARGRGRRRRAGPVHGARRPGARRRGPGQERRPRSGTHAAAADDDHDDDDGGGGGGTAVGRHAGGRHGQRGGRARRLRHRVRKVPRHQRPGARSSVGLAQEHFDRSQGQEGQVRGTAADGRHDGGRYAAAHQAGRAGHDERQGADDQHAGADAVRHPGVEETCVRRRQQPRRHHVRGDQRAVARGARPARPFADGPRPGVRPAAAGRPVHRGRRRRRRGRPARSVTGPHA